MKFFSKCLGINRTFSLICCMFWIFSPAEGKTISEVMGSRVILHCRNKSINKLIQLTWKMNDVTLFSFTPLKPLHVSPEALSLNIRMSESESQLHTLIIERAQKSHTGNYTCETNTAAGPEEQTWELIITENVDVKKWKKLVIAVAVPCVCCLILIIALAILLRACKRRTETDIHSPTAEMQEQTEDIYENCLEAANRERRRYNQPYPYKARTHNMK
ncbi:uncharacterized protein LOC121616170 [Chelmon rostratus]|uniref:uncharacterized protein LOC121616170 n=1 Tax=Chelmon rostratus TaxID=109905 RepID=UPI001BEB7B0A|nr:uncharacterized protein LOC121616170 [Chelmon rostratus]